MENNKFIDEISKCKNERTYKFNKIILKNTINIFLILSFFIMVAGFSSYFKQEFKIPIIISSSVIGIIIYIIFLNDIEGIMKINEKIIPILIIILVYIIIKSPIEIIKENVNIENNLIEAIVMAIVYASYNNIILIPIIVSLSNYIKEDTMARKIGIATMIIILVLSIGIINTMWNYPNSSQFDLPIIKILERDKLQQKMYAIVLVIAILTSAISAGYGFLENIKNRRTYKKIAISLCIIGVGVSHFGFSNLVQVLYPVFGMIGIWQLVLIKIAYKKIDGGLVK